MSLYVDTLSTPISVTRTEQRMIGIDAFRDDALGSKGIKVTWMVPQPDGSLQKETISVSDSVRDDWLAKPGFAAFVAAMRDDTKGRTSAA